MAQAPRGKPRSKADWARELYDNTISLETLDEGELAHMRSHPDLTESLFPIWGPAGRRWLTFTTATT